MKVKLAGAALVAALAAATTAAGAQAPVMARILAAGNIGPPRTRTGGLSRCSRAARALAQLR